MEVRPLLTGGVIPGAEVLDLVRAVLDPETVVPLTDTVTVLAPEAVSYDIAVTYWISRDNAALAASIQTAVTAAVTAFVSWQRARLGRDINPSQLIHLMTAAGAKRVTVTAPVYQTLDVWQVGAAGSVSVTYGGLENA